MNGREKTIDAVILGGGLAGLSAGCVLTRAGRAVAVLESGPAVGGLARTIEHEGFRFDLGGHRFIATRKETERFARDLLGGSVAVVPRKSKILLRGRMFDYPLRPANAVFGLGAREVLRILADYGMQRLKNVLRDPAPRSLEDWVVSHFGRALFELYFREYSEKVWGMDCRQISQEWVAKRIEGLSLWKAVKKALLRRSVRDVKTLADRFLYPIRGIGELPDAMGREIEEQGTVRCGTAVLRIDHDQGMVRSVMARDGERVFDLQGREYIATIPLTRLVAMLRPAPPQPVQEAAAKLGYRDMIVVVVMLDREQVTDLTWLYLPEQRIPFGRIHEPKNWSPLMAPRGKTHLVAEFFCSRGDTIWAMSDEELAALTVKHLRDLGFIREEDVIGSRVVRVPNAYPLFHIDFRKHHETILEYLRTFRNLRVAGRTGSYDYQNMDHAIESGIGAAQEILAHQADGTDLSSPSLCGVPMEHADCGVRNAE